MSGSVTILAPAPIREIHTMAGFRGDPQDTGLLKHLKVFGRGISGGHQCENRTHTTRSFSPLESAMDSSSSSSSTTTSSPSISLDVPSSDNRTTQVPIARKSSRISRTVLPSPTSLRTASVPSIPAGPFADPMQDALSSSSPSDSITFSTHSNTRPSFLFGFRMTEGGETAYIVGKERLHVKKQEEPGTIAFYYDGRFYVFRLTSIGNYFVYKASGDGLAILRPDSSIEVVKPSSESKS